MPTDFSQPSEKKPVRHFTKQDFEDGLCDANGIAIQKGGSAMGEDEQKPDTEEQKPAEEEAKTAEETKAEESPAEESPAEESPAEGSGDAQDGGESNK